MSGFFMGTISRAHGRAPKTVLHAQGLCLQKVIIYEGLIILVIYIMKNLNTLLFSSQKV